MPKPSPWSLVNKCATTPPTPFPTPEPDSTINHDRQHAAYKQPTEAARSCLNCRQALAPLVDCAPAYFEQGSIRCGHCGEQVDLWQAALNNAARLSIVPAWALANLGAGK